MYLKRNIESLLQEYAKFPAVAILGPRQSGKTTLAQHYFKKHTYLSFEDPDTRMLAEQDPKRFLKIHENDHGLILDEFQYIPQILSYLQLEIDAKKRPGYFILTGSQNFLMNEHITQSLAGRIGILTLLPFSLDELKKENLLTQTVDAQIIKGYYPRIYESDLAILPFYRSYIQTYVERDVRSLVNIGDIRTFQTFMALCAGRAGQQLNVIDIATSCGISRDTCNEWLSILETSYIIFFLEPYFKNFNKRLTKTPKLYFYDTGLACSLLGILSTDQLAFSPFRGALFENFVVADLFKQYHHIGQNPPLYYWRDQNGRIEVDCIIESGNKMISIEIKSAETINAKFFDQLKQWNEVTETPAKNNYLIYGGDIKQERSEATIVGWEYVGDFVTKILQ